MADPVGLAAVREWVGFTAPPDAAITALLDAGLTPNRVALSILRSRLADQQSAVQSLEVPEDATVRYDRGTQLRALQAQIAELQNLVAREESGGDPEGLPVASVARLVRREPIR